MVKEGGAEIEKRRNAGRIDDLRKQTNERIDDLRDTLRAEASQNHSEMLVQFAELDSRLLRLAGGAYPGSARACGSVN